MDPDVLLAKPRRTVREWLYFHNEATGYADWRAQEADWRARQAIAERED